MNTIRILLSANDSFAMPMTVAAHSAASRIPNGHSVEINIINDGISEPNRRRATSILQKSHPHASVVWHDIDLTRFDGIDARQFGRASLARVLAPHLFGDSVERVLYIDSDLVVETDISSLWTIELGDKAVWAVDNIHDLGFPTLFSSLRPDAVVEEDMGYFNSGVLLINLPEWRRQRLTEECVELLYKSSDLLAFPDQHALNVAVAGRWGRLPARWNKQVINLSHPDSAPLSEPGILHFSAFKPWHSTYCWPGSRVFHLAYMRTGWDSVFHTCRTVVRLAAGQLVARNKIRIGYRFNIHFD